MSLLDSPEFSAQWERPAVSAMGDRAVLMLWIKTASAAHATAGPPLDVAFALDRSGSMSGEPIRLAKQAVEVAGASLRLKDRVSLVVYDDQVDVVHPLQPASATARNDLRRALDGIAARGSTNLCNG